MFSCPGRLHKGLERVHINTCWNSQRVLIGTSQDTARQRLSHGPFLPALPRVKNCSHNKQLRTDFGWWSEVQSQPRPPLLDTRSAGPFAIQAGFKALCPGLGACKGGCWPLRGAGGCAGACFRLSLFWSLGQSGDIPVHPPSQNFSDPLPPSLPPFSSRCYGAESGLGPSPHLSSLELLSPKALRSLPCHPCSALLANPGAWAELGGHGSWG